MKPKNHCGVMEALKFVDAHIHLSDPEYNQKVGGVIEDAQTSNVVAVVSNSMDLKTSVLSLQLAKEYSGIVYAALGIHPWNIGHLLPNETQDTVDLISQIGTSNDRLVAVGEIGLDPQYGKSEEHHNLQLLVFDKMLRAAEKSNLPVIIHSRGSQSEVLGILPSYRLKGVLLHWFGGSVELLPQIMDRGYYISEGPTSVYSDKTREIIKQVAINNLLTETDGPVRFSGPFKGRMTTPAFISAVVRAIAELKEMKETEVAGQILQNFRQLFKVNVP